MMKDQSPTTSFLVAGSAAGVLAAVVTQPADTIKTRMQVCRAHLHPMKVTADDHLGDCFISLLASRQGSDMVEHLHPSCPDLKTLQSFGRATMITL